MSDISNLWSGIIPDIGGDPAARAALQEKYALMQQSFTSNVDYVPPSYVHTGTGNMATVGWTNQNQRGGANPFPPYSTEGIGVVPDWTGDTNSIGAGRWDQNQVVADTPVNNLNRAPRGNYETYLPQDIPNPNTLPMDVSGSSGGDLEY